MRHFYLIQQLMTSWPEPGKKFFKLTILLFIANTLFAQSPQAFKYQAVARDTSGGLISGQAIDIRISILADSANGNIAYQEIHSTITNNYGLVNLSIGTGTPASGAFANINWGASPHFLQAEVDMGSGYVPMGTSPLLSVPYALYAEPDADWAFNGTDIYNANSGNIGIGTSAPGENLHIAGGDLLLLSLIHI